VADTSAEVQSQQIAQAYGLASEVATATVATAKAVGAHPFDLANVIAYESGWSPSARNAKSGNAGLIQFSADSAAKLGTSTAQIQQMGALDQLGLVERYLRAYSGKGLGRPEALFMAIFYPAAINWPRDRVFPPKVQKANGGIRTPADYVSRARNRARLPASSDLSLPPASGPTRPGDRSSKPGSYPVLRMALGVAAVGCLIVAGAAAWARWKMRQPAQLATNPPRATGPQGRSYRKVQARGPHRRGRGRRSRRRP